MMTLIDTPADYDFDPYPRQPVTLFEDEEIEESALTYEMEAAWELEQERAWEARYQAEIDEYQAEADKFEESELEVLYA